MNVAVSAKKPTPQPVEDVQAHADTRQIPINKVGIKDIYHPVKVKDRSRGEQHTVANFNMYVNLPHNFKRSHITLTAKLVEHMWLEELIEIAEREASCEVYGILKRPDEKFVTERAYDNPKFVEDTVRDVAVALNKDKRVKAYVVESENFESIHN